MKKVNTIIRLTFVLVCLASLHAQAATPDIYRTLDFHSQLINDGLYNGDISPKEFRKLEKDQAKIRRRIDCLGNYYSDGDIAKIRRMQQRAEERIFKRLNYRERRNNYRSSNGQNVRYYNNNSRYDNKRKRRKRSRRTRNYCGPSN